MPSRTPEESDKVAAQRALTRIRCLVRNRAFVTDLLEVRRSQDFDRRIEVLTEFQRKWGLQWFPHRLTTAGDHVSSTPARYEEIIFEEMREVLHSTRPNDRFIILPAVVAKEPIDEYWEAHDPEDDSSVPPDIPGPGKILNIRVDLNYPQDVLEGLIRGELRIAKARREQLQNIGALPLEPDRLHVEKVDFYLQVYDKAEAGEPYRLIARTLRRPKSSVQYAHVVAKLLIGGPPSVRSRPRTHIEGQARSSPDPATYTRQHDRQCEICQAAEHYQDRCAGYRSWAQDHIRVDYIPFNELHSDGSEMEH